MRVLVPNLGSTSLKCQLIEMDGEKVLARGKIDRIGSAQADTTFWDSNGNATQIAGAIPDHRAAIKILLSGLGQLKLAGKQGRAIDAVGFKAVHGGVRYQGTFPVTDHMLTAMADLIPAFPVHNPVYIQAIQIFRELLPDVPMVAAFETGFHATIPEEACVYGIPYEWTEKYGMRRFGFHGATHQYVSERVPEILGRSPRGLRLIACHLGGGASLCAIKDGKSVEFGGGFSGQSGLEGATRSGEFDAFGMTYLMEKENLSTAQIREVLCTRGGLLGISGLSGDMRNLEEAAAKGHQRAALAIKVFVYHAKKYLGSFAVAMGGVDVLSFAGGIGENSWYVRQQVCRGLEFLGIYLDDEKNRAPGTGDRILSRADSPVPVLLVYTNEEIIVARETRRVLQESRAA
jgi:acetate kinase